VGIAIYYRISGSRMSFSLKGTVFALPVMSVAVQVIDLTFTPAGRMSKW
jgi:hypothetical protein